MSFWSAIRISLYLSSATLLLLPPLTLVSVLGAIGCVIIAGVNMLVDYNSQVSHNIQNSESVHNEKQNTGMWCRMCGGSCDLENCGMEQS